VSHGVPLSLAAAMPRRATDVEIICVIEPMPMVFRNYLKTHILQTAQEMLVDKATTVLTPLPAPELRCWWAVGVC